MSAIAYSYLRFSTPDQASGDSRRRQMDLPRLASALPSTSGSATASP